MKAKFLKVSLTAALLATFVFPAAQTFAAISATPTSSTVLVDGKSKTFDSYNINGFNYFKLRDIAYVMNGTSKQFGIDWDAANNAMTLKTGTAYAAAGGEMAGKGSAVKSATLSNQKVLLAGNGKQIPIEAYNIEGYNYFKLRDVGMVLDIGIGWDDGKNTISILSTKGYVESQTVDALDKAVGDAIIANLKGMFGNAELLTQAHITLKTIQSGNNTTVYAWVLYEQFTRAGNEINNVGAIIAPMAITFKKDSAGNYQLVEFWHPEDGDRNIPSIKNKFPQDLWNAALYNQGLYSNALFASTQKQAHDYFDNNTTDLMGHISNFSASGMKFDFNQIEWLTKDNPQRAKELGIDVNNDMPGGFYVYELNNGTKSYSFTSNLIIQLLNRYDNMHSYQSIRVSDFSKWLVDNNSGTGIWHININKNSNTVTSITEQYVP